MIGIKLFYHGHKCAEYSVWTFSQKEMYIEVL